jgi:glycerate kinase
VRILIAPQEFKGSLTAAEAAEAIAAGVRRGAPRAVLDVVPLSDGGPGLVDALAAAMGGTVVRTAVRDPLMRPIDATWARLPERTAVIEMAAASGLSLLAADERDPLRATTFGSGELIRAALDAGCSTIIFGIGGSATVDAGAGAMQALGARLLDAEGAELPPGGAALARLARIDASGVDPRLAASTIRVAADVRNTLCGPHGAAAMYGPQKGASPDDVVTLEHALQRFAGVADEQFCVDVMTVEGGGAAGGLAAGLMLIAPVRIEPGFAIVAEAVDLERRIATADLVITGEGRLDDQSAFGKTCARVAEMARRHGKRVIVIAGSVEAREATLRMFDTVVSLTDGGVSIDDAMRDGARLLERTAERVARDFAASGDDAAD